MSLVPSTRHLTYCVYLRNLASLSNLEVVGEASFDIVNLDSSNTIETTLFLLALPVSQWLTFPPE